MKSDDLHEKNGAIGGADATSLCPTESLRRRSSQIFSDRLQEVCSKTDRLFIWVFLVQWLTAILTALLISPGAWGVPQDAFSIHLQIALVCGSLLTSVPVVLTLRCPGRLVTRLVISGAQGGFSVLFIYLTCGRLETHFHIFGSLAMLAIYRDYRALIPTTAVAVLSTSAAGYLWPESVFNVSSFRPWLIVEHVGWILFADGFLVWSCLKSEGGMRQAAESMALLELNNSLVESKMALRNRQIAERTKKLEESHRKEVTLRNKLLQAQRLESIGQLAAGVAHEINTPMQYVNDNLAYLSDCTRGMFQLLDSYQFNLSADSGERPWENRKADIETMREQCHFDYMREQVPQAVAESMEGVQRVITIVRAMKEFSHPGTTEKVSTDINQALRSTATISKNRWKYCADLILELSDELPDVKTLPSELNQVLLNLVVNAGDAIASRIGETTGMKGTITIRTYAEADSVVIAISDTGCGIPDGIQHRIFDPFFTTKEVGKGTGQGLAISHNIIVNKHGGQLDFSTTPGEGTTFYIRLPAVTRCAKQVCEEPEAVLIEA
jgi:signal transduction histidine kinase